MRFRKIWWGSGRLLGELCEVPRCPLWRGLRCHCPMYSVFCIFFNKCLFFILHGWILSGQTIYTHIHTMLQNMYYLYVFNSKIIFNYIYLYYIFNFQINIVYIKIIYITKYFQITYITKHIKLYIYTKMIIYEDFYIISSSQRKIP